MLEKSQVLEAIEQRRDEIADCLVKMVQIPSVTGDEVAVSNYLRQKMEEMGLEVQTVEAEPGRPNLLAEWFGEEPGPRFIFNGHMDVFPPVDADPGLYGPWSGKVVDGKIYGRGAIDMKGGDTAALMTVKILMDLGWKPKGSILLSYMCDEENGSRLGAKYLVSKELLNGDYGICMEPTNLEILTGLGGIYRAFYTYTSEGMHSPAYHPEGNALEKAHRAVGELLKLSEEIRQRQTDSPKKRPSLAITTCHAGKATNLHPSMATFSVDRRFTYEETLESVQAEIAAVLDPLKEQYPGMDYTVEIQSDRPPLNVPENCEMVQRMTKVWEDLMQKPCHYRYVQGGADASSIVNHNNMQMIVCGPSDGKVSVGDANEYVRIDDLVTAVKIYALTLLELMS